MAATILDPNARFELKPGSGGVSRLSLSGRLDATSTTSLWKQLDARFRQSPISAPDVDASGVDYCAGAGLALLHFLNLGGLAPPGAKVTVRGLKPEFQALF